MSPKEAKAIKLGQFIFKIVLLGLVIISGVLAAFFQTRHLVTKSTHLYSVESMQSDAAIFERVLDEKIEARNSAEEGNTGSEEGSGVSPEIQYAYLQPMLESDVFTDCIVFLTDVDGVILARTELAGYSVPKENFFDNFAADGFEGITPEQLRAALLTGMRCDFSVTGNQKETVVVRPLKAEDLRLFYIMHQKDAEQPYSRNSEYVKTLWLLSIAYIIVVLGYVIITVQYSVSYKKAGELKLSQSDQAGKKIQKQARSYSEVASMLSQNYVKIYTVDLSDDRYVEFVPAAKNRGKSRLNEGANFWGVVIGWLIGCTAEEDREEVRRFLDRKTLLEKARSEETNRLRFRMQVDGKTAYCDLRACLSDVEGQHNLVLGLKNVDELVSRDKLLLAEKDTALRRVDTYRRALLHNMLGYVELDLSEGRVTDGPFVMDVNGEMRTLNLPRVKKYLSFREMLSFWSQRISSADAKEFVTKNDCDYLRQEYEKGNRLVELDCTANWLDGSMRDIRQTYYLTNTRDGSVAALCVLSDRTEEVSREKEIVNLTEELERSRVKISTGQMQPHFLYNVLGSIREIILEDPEYASDLICDFTTHLRACIKSLSNDDLVPFAKEIENIKAYVNIERMRFGDRMQVEFDIQNADFSVVPLSIQPLVENAIRHGLYPKKGPGFVKISAYLQNGYHVIAIKDNGVGFDYEKITREIREHKRDSAGIRNLTLRLEKVMNAKVYFDSTIGAGTTVTVLIPEQKEEEE